MRFHFLLIVTYADRFNNDTQYDQASQWSILWVPRLGDAIATSVYRDHGVNYMFDDSNDTFW